MLSELKQKLVGTFVTVCSVVFTLGPIGCAIWFWTLHLLNPWLNMVCGFLVALVLYVAEFILLVEINI